MEAREAPPQIGISAAGWSIIGVTIAWAVLATGAICLRVWVRIAKGHLFGMDDWFAFAALPCLYVLSACSICIVTRGGLGSHLIDLLIQDPRVVEKLSFWVFMGETPSNLILCLAKMSILCLFRRILPTKLIKHGSTALGIVILTWGIIVIVQTFIQCQPLEKVWRPALPGTCVNQFDYFLAVSISNIAIDVPIILLPIYDIHQLRMSLRQRLAIYSILLLGALMVVTSCIRLKSLLDLRDNIYRGNFDVTIIYEFAWITTITEPAASIICACLPTLHPLIFLFFGRWLRAPKSAQDRASKFGLGGSKHSRSGDVELLKGSMPSTLSTERLYGRSSFDDAADGIWDASQVLQRTVTIVGGSDASDPNLSKPPKNIAARRSQVG